MNLAKNILKAYGNLVECATLTFGKCAYFEGVKRVIEYSPACIKIAYTQGIVFVEGDNLFIEKYYQSDLLIVGKIKAVRYE